MTRAALAIHCRLWKPDQTHNWRPILDSDKSILGGQFHIRLVDKKQSKLDKDKE